MNKKIPTMYHIVDMRFGPNSTSISDIWKTNFSQTALLLPVSLSVSHASFFEAIYSGG